MTTQPKHIHARQTMPFGQIRLLLLVGTTALGCDGVAARSGVRGDQRADDDTSPLFLSRSRDFSSADFKYFRGDDVFIKVHAPQINGEELKRRTVILSQQSTKTEHSLEWDGDDGYSTSVSLDWFSPGKVGVRLILQDNDGDRIVRRGKIRLERPEKCDAPREEGGWESDLVHCNRRSLEYEPTENGSTLPDFGHVGYHNGEDLPFVESYLPDGPLAPLPGDNTSRIQAALDQASEMVSNGVAHQVAVELAPGTFELNSPTPLFIRNSGVVLRGAGSMLGEAGTTLESNTNTKIHSVIRMGCEPPEREIPYWSETDGIQPVVEPVEIGAQIIRVADGSGLRRGDIVMLRQDLNDAWYDVADPFGHWTSTRSIPRHNLSYTRTIKGIQGNTILLDGPVFSNLDPAHGDISLRRYQEESQRVCYENGIEHLRIEISIDNELDEDHAQGGINVRGSIDSWIRDVTISNYTEDGIEIEKSLRVTVESVVVGPPSGQLAGGKQYGVEASNGAQEVLVADSTAIGNRHGFIANGGTRSSGIVFVRCQLEDNVGPSEGGHRRWSTGVLFDNCRVSSSRPLGQADFKIGWTGAGRHAMGSTNSVLWNVSGWTEDGTASRFLVTKPPLGQNFCIGCSGRVNDYLNQNPDGWGHIESAIPPRAGVNCDACIHEPGPSELYPRSLYEAQLAARGRGE